MSVSLTCIGKAATGMGFFAGLVALSYFATFWFRPYFETFWLSAKRTWRAPAFAPRIPYKYNGRWRAQHVGSMRHFALNACKCNSWFWVPTRVLRTTLLPTVWLTILPTSTFLTTTCRVHAQAKFEFDIWHSKLEPYSERCSSRQPSVYCH